MNDTQDNEVLLQEQTALRMVVRFIPRQRQVQNPLNEQLFALYAVVRRLGLVRVAEKLEGIVGNINNLYIGSVINVSVIENIRQMPNSRLPENVQFGYARDIANRLGLYDASDFFRAAYNA